MHDMMIDIETMGKRPNAPVLSIGSVMFNRETGELGKQFYAAVDPVDALRHGKPDGDTLKWWMSQSDAARNAAMAGTMSLKEALMGLSRATDRDWKDVKVWGNGPSFDMTILEYAYHSAMGALAPWRFWNVCCCRTVAVMSGRRPPQIGGEGTHHNALDDAIHQAKWVSQMWMEIKGKPKSDDEDLLV